MAHSFRLLDTDPAAVRGLVSQLGIHPVTARCMIARGIDEPARATAYLNPRLSDLRAPVGMAGFERAVSRLCLAVSRGERVGVFGDYDVDGVTSAALMCWFLRRVGGTPVPRVARRGGGYGFGPQDASWFVQEGCTIVLTLDCGTSDVPAILSLTERGIDTIVVDHHQVPERKVHPAHALVNPHRPDSTYPFRGLASVGLCFFLAAAARTKLRDRGWFASRPEPDVRELLDLVAVGTIADLAPLCEENRVLAALGLRELQAQRRAGWGALLRLAGVELDRPLDEVDIAWRIGPRLNAPGRLKDATPALDLLLAANPQEAAAHALSCEQANEARRSLQEKTFHEALEDSLARSGDPIVTVARLGWHAGVVGIVAAKLVERLGKPAVVIAGDESTGEGRGSMRTTFGLNAYEALASCKDLLVRFGGHAQAAGLTVVMDNVPTLRERLIQTAGTLLGEVTPSRTEVDAVVPLSVVDDALAQEITRMAPFGPGNREPILAAVRARVRSSRRVGDGSHLKLLLECSEKGTRHAAIGFRMGPRDPGEGAVVDVAFSPLISYFRGERRVELKVHELSPS
ncbi:MAG: single-stranded-DNA-specific exonuclease RecJ [Deltaproteobacteria bacterium]|nr:single-stranded-DNA-specific exonuclease RecJ [Deltaproteobacteria bacterium]